MQKKENNPFMFTFERKPIAYISRMSINAEITQIFQQDKRLKLFKTSSIF